jgi:hypothetical protein
MAKLTIFYWRDIPAQVVAKAGREEARRELEPRFLMAIDSAAMKASMHGNDAYLEQWRRGTPEACGDDLEAEVEAAKERLESTYDRRRLAALVKSGGVADESTGA